MKKNFYHHLKLHRNAAVMLFLCLFLFGKTYAGEPVFTKRIYASASPAVKIGTTSASEEVEASPKTGPFTDVRVDNRIILGINLNSTTFFSANFTSTVKVKIERWDKNNQSQQTLSEKLTVQYSPFGNQVPYIDKSIFTFNDSYRVKFTIDSIYTDGVSVQELPLNVYVESEISIDRHINFASVAATPFTINTPAFLNTDCDSKGIYDEIQLTWNTCINTGSGLVCPEEYQLEWTFINDYGTSTGVYLAPGTLKYDFKNNSTRITTSDNNYKITLTFEHGYLLYRVRGIGRDVNDPSIPIVGVWSSPDEAGFVGSFSNVTPITQEHEKDKNWQFAATFAEEGKKKEVINYFDGSLRNRQSVTKINSDFNVIVGQTIYDYQGRAAVNVLPVPVKYPSCNTTFNSPAIAFYPLFNRFNATTAYSRKNFDEDAAATDSCSSITAGMDTGFGASNYYSSANPNKKGFQAYVPDAEKYPFTQAEFTSDNTGRIKKQSGAGPQYKLGTGHETSYFYGQPHQIQLDRLFGSEAGDAAHYKKNVVVDANGQSSVSYLDQEGRTIATSLAGNTPTDASGKPILSKLPSESDAVKNLTVDLFAKNALGQSNLNTRTTENDGLVFNSQLLVAYKSNYIFNYNLSVDTITDDCLKQNICFTCAYDLEIKVTDDCGRDITKLANGGNSIKKTIGSFTQANGKITFNTNCNTPSKLSDVETFTLDSLLPGNYTVSKILKINKEAKDFYVNAYLDTINTANEKGKWVNVKDSCFRTLQSFIDTALAHVDTTDCNISCQTCVASLGTRDAWVANGKGTELEYDILKEQCEQPCKLISVCEATYKQLLSDVSPDGQYAEFRTANGGIAPGNFPLSVLNAVNNVLPKTIAGQQANWKNPIVSINGNTYSYYLEENGSRSIIPLTPDGTNYLPKVTDIALVKSDQAGDYYTYPENLANIEDFVANWKDTWAKSLVHYHPEYCYYEACKSYGEKQGADMLTSDEFDAKLIQAETFADAVNAKLINNNYRNPNASNASKVADFFTANATGIPPYDPFAVTGSVFQSNLGTLSFIISTSLKNKFNNYQTYQPASGPSISYSMLDMAAIAARCGTKYGAQPAGTCLKFGTDYYTGAGSNALNESIRDKEWTIFKNFYLSEKAKLQQKRADEYATKTCNGYNGCIGNDHYNPFTLGMFNSPWINSPYFNSKQPCSWHYFRKYRKKHKRFITPADIPSQNAAELDYQFYLQTGQCPLAVDMQYLLSGLANSKDLMNATGADLQVYGEFTQDLYNELNGTAQPNQFIAYKWENTTLSGNDATFNFINSNTNLSAGNVTLDKTGIASWNDIIGIKQLKYTSFSAGSYSFDALAQVAVNGGTSFVYKPIKGTTTVKITGCNFSFTCEPNDFALDINNLWSALIANGKLKSANVSLNIADYAPFITGSIKNQLGTTSTNLIWNYNGSQYELWDAAVAVPSKKLVTKFNTFTPNTYNNDNLYPTVKAFADVKSNYENFFIMKGINSSGAEVVTIEGEVFIEDGSTKKGVAMGKCELPESINCKGDPFQLKEDLEALLKDVLVKKPFTGNIDLTKSTRYTNLIENYFPEGLLSTSSVNSSQTNGSSVKETLQFTIAGTNDSCNLIVHREGATPALFSNLVKFYGLTTTGEAAFDGNFYRFSAIGEYQVNGQTYMDTIFGESCLPLKDCNSCAGTIGAVDTVTSVSVAATAAVDSCQTNYNAFKQLITNYNKSAYAKKQKHSLDPNIYPTFDLFVQAGLCNCVIAYINYLTPYITLSAKSPIPVPVDINHYAGCTVTPPPLNSCNSAYQKYAVTVAAYNQYVVNNPQLLLPSVNPVYQELAFTNSGYCNCADKYTAFLQTIMNGTADLSEPSLLPAKLDIAQTCVQDMLPPCNPQLPNDDTMSSPAFTKYDNPCAKYLKDLAVANAQNEYSNYINSITTTIAARYTEHCLSALENFSVAYQDKEYHFTLYYYDQAGNLVRTIPPEGVVPVDITSSTDPIAIQINQDRTFNKQTFTTDHSMRTTYEYNSLNQLVKQSLPDHDLMNIWEYTLPNGLDNRLKITATQFVSPNKGYLTGYIDVNANLKRGYLYTSDDGGISWIKMNDLAASDLKKIQMADAATGFAVGSYGIILKTTDNGNNWDMLPMYNLNITSQFNDLYFINALKGIAVGNNGKIVKTIDGGNTFTDASPTNFIGYHIVSLTYDGSSFFAIGNNSLTNTLRIAKGTVNTANMNITWAIQTGIRATDLNTIGIPLNGAAGIFAAGIDGTLLRSTTIGAAWTVLATGISNAFKDVYFKNAKEGIAIIDSVAGKGRLWRTNDGGTTWIQVSPAGQDYNSLYFYQNDKGYAAGSNGIMKRIVMNDEDHVGLVNIPTTFSTLNIAALYFESPDKGWAAGNNATVYYTSNATAAIPAWTAVNTGISAADASFKKIYFENNKGILLSNTGKIYKITANGTAYTFTNITTTENYAAIAANNNRVFAYDRTSNKIKYVNKSAISLVTTTTLTTAVFAAGADLPIAANVNNISIRGNTLFFAGKSGDIFRALVANVNNVSCKNFSNTLRINPACNDVQAVSANNVYVAGTDGNLLETTNGSDWRYLTTGTAERLNAIKFNTSTSGLIVADNGKAWKHSLSGAQANLILLPLSTSSNLNDVVLKADNSAYIAGDNGTLIYLNDIALPQPAFSPLPVAGNLYGLTFNNNGGIYATGDKSGIFSYAATTGAKIKNVFTPTLNSVHFLTSHMGYLVGDKGTIRYTGNGGFSWNVVLPSILSNGTNIPQLNAVWTTQPGKAVIVGNFNYIANITGTTISGFSGGVSGQHLNALSVSTDGTGFMVGNGGAALNTTNYGVTWAVLPASGASLNALHVFSNTTFIAVGTAGAITYFDGTAWSNKAPAGYSTATFKDVFFHDDKNGYAAGNNGIILKAIVPSTITTGISWSAMPSKDLFGVSDSTKINVTTIDFPRRYNGFVGGYFNDVRTNANYSRLVHDEALLFSSFFYYDRLGRQALSQNTKQFNKKPKAWSYTKYDALGRITEVGEKAENATGNLQFAGIFGEYVNGKYNPRVINDAKLNAWLTTNPGSRTEVTKTFYDKQSILPVNVLVQENLRKRVVSVTYEDVNDNDSLTYQHATHFSYDIHGNVKTIVQDNPSLAGIGSPSGAGGKRIDYEYDLISGKVNTVKYQNGQPDAFHHHYEYDADNRITHVYTSKYPNARWTGVQGDPLWDNDAKYFYYAHGPLARVEIGDNQVQGMDYAYTLQGWIKGVNSTTLDSTRDIGKDGFNPNNSSLLPNRYFAKDAFGYSLNYFNGDYKAIEGLIWNTLTNRFEAYSPNNSDVAGARKDLFNGNISSMVTTITNPVTREVLPQATAYSYDQLNRLTEMQAYSNIDINLNQWKSSGSAYNGMYHNKFTYDANGSMLTALAKNQAGQIIDDQTYQHQTIGGKKFSNRTYAINDAATQTSGDDLLDQLAFDNTATTINSVNNYSYTEIGERKSNKQDSIDLITWTVYGKVKSVKRTPGCSKYNVTFDYDASGNRVAKHVYTSADAWIRSEYYIKDAQGNIMSTYEYTAAGASMSFAQTERPIYGSSSLGIDVTKTEMISALPALNPSSHFLGNKHYTGSNHLGNVLTVVSDRKIPVGSATVAVINDDTFSDGGTHGWNSCGGSSFVTNYLGGLGVYSTDDLSEITCVATKNILIEAGKNYQITIDIPFVTPGINEMAILIGTQVLPLVAGPNTVNFTATATVNSIQLGLSGDVAYFPPVGMPLVGFLSISIKIVTNTTKISYLADILSASDYAPFGAFLTERTFNKGAFPNSFNGKRDDKELNIQDYGMRPYSPMERELGWKIDDLTKSYPELSSYQFASNSPIMGIDLDGLELLQRVYNTGADGKTKLVKTTYIPPSQREPGKFGTNITVNTTGGSTSFYNPSPNDKPSQSNPASDPSPPPPAKSALEQFGGAMESIIRPGNSNTYSWEGEKGLKEKGIPTMLTTVTSIVTLGAAAEVGLAGGLAKTIFGASMTSNVDDFAGTAMNMKDGATPISKITGSSPSMVNLIKMGVSGVSLTQGLKTIANDGLKKVNTGMFNTVSPVSDAVSATSQAAGAATETK